MIIAMSDIHFTPPNLFVNPNLRHFLQMSTYFNLLPPSTLAISGELPTPYLLDPPTIREARILRFANLTNKTKIFLRRSCNYILIPTMCTFIILSRGTPSISTLSCLSANGRSWMGGSSIGPISVAKWLN